MTTDTVVQIGSLTKVFNATIVMTLVDEGKLTLDAPVSQYIPDLKMGGKRASDNVTLRRLLSMSAGIDFGPSDAPFGENAIGRYVASLSDIPLVYPTGQGFGYSNASACIAANAAEKVTGLPWDTLLKKRVFEPAGLNHASNAPTDLAYFHVAVGHTPVQNGQPVKVFRPWHTNSGLNPSGSGSTIAISAQDLVSFGQVFLNGGKAANGNRVLSEAAVKAMMTSTTSVRMGAPQWGTGDQWGLGPTLAQWGNTAVWGHGGSALGGSSLLLWIPDKHAVLAFTINSPTVFEAFAARFTSDFAQTLLGIHAPEAPRAAARPMRSEHPERLVGNYVRAGDRIEISERAGRLHFIEINDEISARYRLMNEKIEPGPLVDMDMTPLGSDRFLVNFPGFANGIAVFFFGKDAQGRATSINFGLRSSRRVE
jgi:CubicO group peptidase (beta-lactamase class C family)